MSGGVDGVSFTNINIRNSGPSVRIKSQCGRRAYVRNVLYVPTPGLRPANSIIICTPKSFANNINVMCCTDYRYENITADEVANAVWIDMMYFSKVSTCPADQVNMSSNIGRLSLVDSDAVLSGDNFVRIIKQRLAVPVHGIAEWTNVTRDGSY